MKSPIPHGLSKSVLMKNLRKDAFQALQEANPLVSRQVLRNNSRILADDWYRKIQSGEIQFGVRVENGGNGEQESAGNHKLSKLLRFGRLKRRRDSGRQRSG